MSPTPEATFDRNPKNPDAFCFGWEIPKGSAALLARILIASLNNIIFSMSMSALPSVDSAFAIGIRDFAIEDIAKLPNTIRGNNRPAAVKVATNIPTEVAKESMFSPPTFATDSNIGMNDCIAPPIKSNDNEPNAMGTKAKPANVVIAVNNPMPIDRAIILPMSISAPERNCRKGRND